MKKHLKTTSLILCFIMLAASLTGCMGNGITETPSNTDTGNPNQTQSVNTGDPSTEMPTQSTDITDFITDTNDFLNTDITDLPQNDTSTNLGIPDTNVTEQPTDAPTEITPPATDTQAPETQAPGTQAPETQAPETQAPTVTPTEFPQNTFPLLANGKYLIRLTTADNPTSGERLVAFELKKALKTKTTVDIVTSTDYTAADSSTYEILIGKTSRKESTGVYNSISFNTYGVKIVGNKIVFFFTTENEGMELIDQFTKSIRSNDEGQFWVTNTLSLVNTAIPELNSLPKFPEEDGKLSTVDCYDNTKMVVVKNTTLAKFNEYLSTLKSSKYNYVQYSTRTVEGNYFYILTKGNTAINAYFSSGRSQARIIVGPLKDIPSKDVDKTPETVKPSVTMIGPSESTENGLGLVYHLANGKFLVIDGGHILSDRIYKELRELQPDGKKLVIAGWFISHPHNDHQDSIENFITLHANEVEIENIYFNYVNPSYYDNLSSQYHQGEDQKEGARVTRLRELLAKKLSINTRIVKPHTGQVYTFGSAKVEIISTTEDFLPTKLTHVNDSSMVVRVTVAGQSCMVLADAADGMKDIILSMYNSSLKSDMVTLAHHGTWDTRPALYNKIQGKVLFWPSNTAGAREYYGKSDTSEGKKAIVAALNNATDVFLAKGTDTKLMLPYTPVGNKSSFINSTLK